MNENALVTQMKSGALNLFKEVDFGTLNQAIDTLGNNSQHLTDGEKDNALDILNTWENGVVEKLEQRIHDIENVVKFVDQQYKISNYHYNVSIDEKKMEEIARISETNEQYQEYIQSKDKLSELRHEKPLEFHKNDYSDRTMNDIADLQIEHETEMLRYNNKLRRAEKDEERALRQWKISISRSKIFKDFINVLKDHVSKLKNYKVEAKDKSSLAKLSISIPNADIREAIKGMVNFTRSI